MASGLSFGHSPTGVMTTLCFFRFWLGFGIGGDYPLSATIMSEYANKRTRGAFIAAVFAMQGFGILTGGIVTLIISAAFRARFDTPTYQVWITTVYCQIYVCYLYICIIYLFLTFTLFCLWYQENPIASTPEHADFVWRIILMFGAIPALMTYYWRMKMPETARYTALVAKNAKQAASDMSKVLQVEIVEDPEKVTPLVLLLIMALYFGEPVMGNCLLPRKTSRKKFSFCYHKN